MSRTVLSIVLGATLVAVTTAHAGGPPPRPGFRPSSDEAIDLFNAGVVSLYNDVNNGGCPIPKVEQSLAALAKLDKGVASVKDAADKAAITDWAREMRAFLEAHRGVPGVGDWAAVDAAIAAARARPAFAMPDDLSSDAALDQVIGRAVQARRDGATVSAITSHASMKLYNCDDRGAGELARRFHGETAELDTAIFKVAERLRYDRFEPFLGLVRRLGEHDVATWDGHAHWVRDAIETVAAARALVAMEPRLAALDEFTGGAPVKRAPDARTRPLAVLAVAQQQLVDLPPLIAQRLPEVGFPKVPAKDKARDKVIAGFITGGDTIAFGPRYYAKTNTQSYSEIDPVDHLSHAVEREVANGYVAVRKASWTEALAEGVAADDLCELRWFNFFRYKKAGPSHEKKKWLVNVEGGSSKYVGPILCKNAARVTSLRM